MKLISRSHSGLLLFLVVGLLIPVFGAAAARPQDPVSVNYRIIRKVTLWGTGFWDYLGFDSQNDQLFVSHSTHVPVLAP